MFKHRLSNAVHHIVCQQNYVINYVGDILDIDVLSWINTSFDALNLPLHDLVFESFQMKLVSPTT